MATGKGTLVRFPSAEITTEAWQDERASNRDATEADLSGGRTMLVTSARHVTPAKIVPISFLGVANLVLRQPLHAVVEESPTGDFIAAAYDLELAGQGDTEFQALDDLREQVVELFLGLREMKDRLPEHLRTRLAFLETLTQ